MSRVSGLAERIRLHVLRGETPPGGWLVEVHLAQEFEVPRATIRQALRLLEGQGLLVADDSGGMRVVAPGAQDVAEALEVRAALEGLAAEAAAARGLGADTVARLLALAGGPAAPAGRVPAGGARATAGPDSAPPGAPPSAPVLADRTFHRALSVCADNRAAHVALDRLWDRLVVARAAPGRAADHAELVRLIAAGDAAAAGALARRHVLSGNA